MPRPTVCVCVVCALCLAMPAAAQGASDPALVLDMYMACIQRGDYESALGYCRLGSSADANAARELRNAVAGIAAEVDLLGVVRALSLFVPLSPSPMEWRLQSPASLSTSSDTVLELRATTTLVFDQRVYLVRSGSVWQIDLERTLLANAEGTKIGAILAARASRVEGMRQLRAIAQAMNRYLDEHGGRLPPADTWQSDLLAYTSLVSAEDFVSPADPSGGPSYAINESIAGLAGRDVADARRTVLLFDAMGVSRGGPSDVAFRHNGEALVLLADGTVTAMRRSDEYKWGGRATGSGAGAVLVRAAMRQGLETVPLADVLAPLGGKVRWVEANNEAVAEGLGRRVVIRPGEATMFVDGRPVTIGGQPVIADGRLFVPVGVPSRAFGLTVRWVEGGIEYR